MKLFHWSCTPREEHGLRMFEMRVMWRTSEPGEEEEEEEEKEEGAGGLRKLHNAELHNL